MRVSLYYAAWNAKLRRDLMTPAITQPRVWRICLIELTMYNAQHSLLHQSRDWLTHRRVNFENNSNRFIGGGRRKRCANKAFVLPDTDYKMEEVLSLYKDKSVRVKWRQMYALTPRIQSRLHVVFGYTRGITFFLIDSVAHNSHKLTKKRLIQSSALEILKL